MAVELNIFHPKVLYLTVLERESSVHVRQTRFQCQIPSLGAWSKDCLVDSAMAYRGRHTIAAGEDLSPEHRWSF